MAEDIKNKRVFHEDIFAEEPEKWSWSAVGSNAKPSGSGVVFDTHTSEVKSDSSSSSESRDGFLFRGGDSNSKRSFRKRASSSASDGSLSPLPSSNASHERLPPSIYDDDAQSGNPSGVFEKKDLAFLSSFKKTINSSPPKRSGDNSTGSEKRNEKSHGSDKEALAEERNSRNSPPRRRDSKDVRSRRSPSDKQPKSSRSHSRSRDKKYRHRSSTRSRSHSRDVRTRSPRGGRRRSRSRDGRSERKKRSRSRSRGRRSRSRDSRRQSRSRSFDRRRGHHRSSSRDRYHRRRYSRSRSHSKDRTKGASSRKPSSLPLSTSGGVAITPQMALQQTMAAMNAKAQALTGIALPKYYNPAAVNPLKYAEQVQKRKLLWQTKEKEEEQPKNSVWDKLTFAQDQDGKMTAKFRKLMGIKSEGGNDITEAEEKESALKKQEVLFRDLDQQYEMARMTTHTQRGVGLGYSIQTLYPAVPK